MPPESPSPEPAPTVTPTPSALFLGFLRIGLLGFGGVAAWARRVIVEERRWLSERDYAEILGMGQILPGPNVGNAAVMIGRRFHGLRGALLATSGMYLAPLCILIALSLLYENFGQEPGVAPVMQGIAAGAAGMVIGTALKMAERLKLTAEAVAILALATVAAAWLRISLPLIVAVLAPVSIAASLWRAGLIGQGGRGAAR